MKQKFPQILIQASPVFLITVIICAKAVSQVTWVQPVYHPLIPRHAPVPQSSPDRAVAVAATWEPISRLFDQVHVGPEVSLVRASSVPDSHLFVASKGTPVSTLFKQIRLVLNDDDWQYRWSRQISGNGHTTYRLNRSALGAEQRHELQVQALRDRLAKLLNVVHSTPDALDQLAQDDPDTVMSLRQPMYQAQLEFVGGLPADQLDAVLAGQALNLPVMGLSETQKELINKIAGDATLGIATDANGASHVVFDKRALESSGEVMIQTIPARDNPQNLSIQMHVATSSEGGLGGDVLSPDTYAALQPQKDAVATRIQVEKQRELAQATSLSTGITINADLPKLNKEPQMVAYLRELVHQSGLTLVANLPTGNDDLKLERTISKRPLSEVLDTLCRTYYCKWTQEDKVVRIFPTEHRSQFSISDTPMLESASDRQYLQRPVVNP